MQNDPKRGTFVTTAFDAGFCLANTHRLAAGDLIGAAPRSILGAAFAAHASVIDNATNDPRTLLPR